MRHKGFQTVALNDIKSVKGNAGRSQSKKI